MTSGPTQPTLKALFAKSSNRCAFPKCTVSLVQGDTLLGHVCHIKGYKPGSARYDPSQNDAERHSDSNLLILCPNHHAVIDDDDETYTAERLYCMKAQHEAGARPLDDATAAAAIKMLVDNSVTSRGQIGGITSGIMNVATLNYSGAPASSLTIEKETQAIEKLWTIIRKMREVHGDIWLAESILTRAEIDRYFQTQNWPASIHTITHYSSFDWGLEQLNRAGANNSDDCRLYVSDQLWGVFATIRALYGRLGVLYNQSFEKGAYVDWRNDNGFATHVGALLGPSLFEQAKAIPFQGLDTILTRAEAEFLREARAMRSMPFVRPEANVSLQLNKIELIFEGSEPYVRPIRSLYGPKGERYFVGLRNGGAATLETITLRAREGWFVQNSIAVAHLRRDRNPLIATFPVLDPAATELVELFGLEYNAGSSSPEDVFNQKQLFQLELRARDTQTVIADFEYDREQRPMIRLLSTSE